MSTLLNPRDISFLLYEFLDTSAVLERPRYAMHSRDILDATIETARVIAEKYFQPHYQKGDQNEPTFDGKSVKVIPETKLAWDAFRNAGFLRAHCCTEEGGLQLPEVALRVSMAYFLAANGPSCALPFLTVGVVNLLRAFGTPEQNDLYLPPLLDGKFSGTMALTESGQGSALADIKTRAELHPDGSYRLFGQKMFISAGEHDMADNIIHMVLARIQGQDGEPTSKGISLFIVPKILVAEDGRSGERNDVALAGLLHKMGSRNSPSTVLNFGERDGAIGYLIGGVGNGLACMFHMMNEARIGVGLGASALAYMGFRHSLDYARQRPQGRLPSNKDSRSPQVMLIEHADVRRMLLAQKAYAEGGLALCLYASSLFEDEYSHPESSRREQAGALLSLLTPIVKSWPSKYGCISNELAIQVMGGAGYTRDYPVEQLYRDQRLNPIHEGAEGIHALDLLGRKVRLNGGLAMRLLDAEFIATINQAEGLGDLSLLADQLTNAWRLLQTCTTDLLAMQKADVDRSLSNATLYLDVFGRVVVSWIWLKQAVTAAKALQSGKSVGDDNYYRGKLHAARYFFEWDLPQVEPAVNLLQSNLSAPFDMKDEWFGY